MFFHNAKNYILDLLFPCFCFGCKKEGGFVCDACFNKIYIENYPICIKCGKLLINTPKCKQCHSETFINKAIIANNRKDETLHKMIYAYKYQFIEPLSAPLSKILISCCRKPFIDECFKELISENKLILMSVPLHKQRFVWRGFNQSELLTNLISQELKVPVFNSVLRRVKNTIPQMEIKTKNERIENIKNAFVADESQKEKIKNKTVILVDDICTTGSTLKECAKALKPLKPKQIWALVLSKG